MFKFFKSLHNPSNLTGSVGGEISTVELSGYLGELFAYVASPPEETTGAYYQYRKIFVKNEHEFSSTNTRLWLDAEQHPGQISISIQTGGSATMANATTEPSGISSWTNPTNYSEGIEIGTISPNAHTGIWLRQTLSNITEPDPYASLRLYIGGIVD